MADIIAAKYEQLDSGNKFGLVGTPAFNVRSKKMASLFDHMSPMSKTEPANAHTASQAAVLQALKSTFSDLKYAGRQSYCVGDTVL